jgi:hypothetical protein
MGSYSSCVDSLTIRATAWLASSLEIALAAATRSS